MASSNGSRHNSKLSAIPAVAVPGRSVVAVERDRCKWDFVHPIYVKPPREQHVRLFSSTANADEGGTTELQQFQAP